MHGYRLLHHLSRAAPAPDKSAPAHSPHRGAPHHSDAQWPRRKPSLEKATRRDAGALARSPDAIAALRKIRFPPLSIALREPAATPGRRATPRGPDPIPPPAAFL